MRRGSAERVGGRTPMKSARTRPSAAAPPAALYQPSSREYTGTLPPVEYPGNFIVKRVTNAGTIRLKKRLLFIANALKQHPVGLEEIAERCVVDPLLPRPARPRRRARLHHPRVNGVSPMFPVYGVTHVPGCSNSSRLEAGNHAVIPEGRLHLNVTKPGVREHRR